jgi:hypothetical protein
MEKIRPRTAPHQRFAGAAFEHPAPFLAHQGSVYCETGPGCINIMNKRPVPVLVIAILYVATGAIGLVFHLMQVKPHSPFEYDIVLASLVSLTAVVAGVYMLRANNWARWLALAWIAFHVVLSIHSPSALVVHSLLCGVFAYFLFRPQATQYFRSARSSAA